MALGLDHESGLWADGARIVAGIDEVGRGALAGPVSVGVCALTPRSHWPHGLADSKALTAARREALAPAVRDWAHGVAVGHAAPGEIDAIGIVAALRLAAMRALGDLAQRGIVADAILLDGTHDWLTSPAADLFDEPDAPAAPPVTMVVKGDGRCASIAGAAIVAKVDRDDLMRTLHTQHPQYGWDGNKGYGAAAHLEALAAHGPSPLHRLSWKLPGVGRD